MNSTARKAYDEVVRIMETEPEFEPQFCTCPYYEHCCHMVYDINMKPRCHYHGSLGKAINDD